MQHCQSRKYIHNTHTLTSVSRGYTIRITLLPLSDGGSLLRKSSFITSGWVGSGAIFVTFRCTWGSETVEKKNQVST